MAPLAIAGIAGGMGLLGAIAGAQGNRSTQNYRTELGPASALEEQSGKLLEEQLKQYQSFVNAGPGQQDITAGLNSQRSLADLLQSYSQGGYLPNQQQMSQANDFTRQLYGGQQYALNTRFQDAQTQASRMAARMGRSPLDPVLMNKMMTERTRQQGQLDADIGSASMQNAMNMPMQQLNFAQQYAQVNAGLASQAMANRQALLSMGSQLRNGEQSFRAGTAARSMEQVGGGGMAGGITGALGGLGAGVGAMSMFSGMAGGGAGAGAGTSAATQGTSGMGMNPRFGTMA